MSTKRGTGRALAARFCIAAGEFLRQLPGVLKIFVLFATAILMLIAALPVSHSDLAGSSPDELLLRLATLGREGASVLCDPESIEKHLSLQIGIKNSKKEPRESPASVNSTNESVSGSYWKFQAEDGVVCRLQLRIAGHRFCDTDSARTQRLIGRRVQVQLGVPGGADYYDHGYELTLDSKARSVIGWRAPSQSCSTDVEISVSTR
jgi:hypothetical protein